MTPADAHARIARLIDTFSGSIRPVPIDVRRAIQALLDASPHLVEPGHADLLAPALSSLLARNADEADRIAEIFARLWAPSPPRVAEPGSPARRPRRPSRLPVLLSILVLAAGSALWAFEPTPEPLIEAALAGADGGVSPIATGGITREPALRHAPSAAGPYRVPFIQLPGSPGALDIKQLGLGLLLLIAAARLWIVFAARDRIAQQAAEALRVRADTAKARVAADELDVRLPAHRPDVWKPPPPGTVAAGHRLSRAYVPEPGSTLDAQKTARRTADAAGRFEPVFAARRRWRRLTVLLDDEGGEHVWAGAFRAIVNSWRTTGVELQAWRFDRDPRHLIALHDNRVATLERLARGALDEPLLILSRSLDPRTGRGRWLRALKGWSMVVWIDPDPRRMRSRRSTERRAIRHLTTRYLLRVPMTVPGMLAAAEALQTRRAHLKSSVPWPGLPNPGEPRVREALDRWRLAVSQKPDATWALVEHLRLTVPGVAVVFRHRHDVQLLIDDIRREGGARRDRPGARPGSGDMLFVEHPAAVEWLYRMLEVGDRGRAVSHRVSDLLIAWERTHRAASPHAQAISAVKVLWHRTKQRPTRARIERLQGLAGTALHDYVEDYIGALAGAADRGLLSLDASARRALVVGRSQVLGEAERVPVDAVWRARWLRTAAAVAALVIVWVGFGWWLWQGLGSIGNQPVAPTWRGDAPLAATTLPVENYFETLDAGIARPRGDSGVRRPRPDGNLSTTTADFGFGAGQTLENLAATPADASRADTGPPADLGPSGDTGEIGDVSLDADPDASDIDAAPGYARPTVVVHRPDGSAAQAPRPPAEDLECAGSVPCRQAGRCVQRRRRCVAANADDCLASAGCRVHGRCTLRVTFCIVGGDPDCREAEACTNSGHCAARGGRCVPSSNADCRASTYCKTVGNCAWRGDICRPGSITDCTASTGCQADGDCGLDPRQPLGDRLCSPVKSAHCTKSSGCVFEGRCTLSDGRCQRLSDADCRRSKLCTAEGRCTLADGQCVATDDDSCRASTDCKILGNCNRFGDRCVALYPEDCQVSCVKAARCTIVAGQCTVGPDDCAKSSLCGVEGRCGTKSGQCIAKTRQGCAESIWGRRYGLRTPVGGTCVAAVSDDCKASDVCRFQGLCTADTGACRAKTARDCRGMCVERGGCVAHGDRCAPGRVGDCKNSRACDKRGACDMVGTGRGAACEPTAPEHCQAAEVCRSDNQCRLQRRKCVEGGR